MVVWYSTFSTTLEPGGFLSDSDYAYVYISSRREDWVFMVKSIGFHFGWGVICWVFLQDHDAGYPKAFEGSFYFTAVVLTSASSREVSVLVDGLLSGTSLC